MKNLINISRTITKVTYKLLQYFHLWPSHFMYPNDNDYVNDNDNDDDDDGSSTRQKF